MVEMYIQEGCKRSNSHDSQEQLLLQILLLFADSSCSEERKTAAELENGQFRIDVVL